MPTYVSILNWSGDPHPTHAELRAAIDERAAMLRTAGLHSVVCLPDAGACAAIMIATTRDEAAVSTLARSIFPAAVLHQDTMLFDDDPGTPAWLTREAPPPPRRDYRRALLEALAADS